MTRSAFSSAQIDGQTAVDFTGQSRETLSARRHKHRGTFHAG